MRATCIFSSARAPNGCARPASASCELRAGEGVVFVVHAMELRFNAPARLDDLLDRDRRSGRAPQCELRSFAQTLYPRTRGARAGRSPCARRLPRRGRVPAAADPRTSSRRDSETMNSELNVLGLVLGASIPVKLVLGILIGFSIASWFIIFRKKALIDRANARRGRIRGALLVRRRSRGPVQGIDFRRRAHHRQRGDLRSRIPRVRAAAPAPRRRFARAARRRAARDARRLDARSRPARTKPRIPRQCRLDQSLRRPLRHGVGHHDRVPGPRQRQGSDDRDGRSGHLRSADRDRYGPLRGDSGRLGLQPLLDQARTHQHALRHVRRGVLLDPRASGARRRPV